MNALLIRKAVSRDAEKIAQLEKICFKDPWSLEQVRDDIEKNKLAFYLVAESEGEIKGYLGIWVISGEGHITNVAVAPAERRKGIASELLKEMLRETGEAGAARWTLEARKSNTEAIALYEKFGFEIYGTRKGYYADNKEDAVIMWRTGQKPGGL